MGIIDNWMSTPQEPFSFCGQKHDSSLLMGSKDRLILFNSAYLPNESSTVVFSCSSCFSDFKSMHLQNLCERTFIRHTHTRTHWVLGYKWTWEADTFITYRMQWMWYTANYWVYSNCDQVVCFNFTFFTKTWHLPLRKYCNSANLRNVKMENPLWSVTIQRILFRFTPS